MPIRRSAFPGINAAEGGNPQVRAGGPDNRLTEGKPVLAQGGARTSKGPALAKSGGTAIGGTLGNVAPYKNVSAEGATQELRSVK